MAPNPYRPKEEKDARGAGWLVTFSDLSTLLLTFFVLLLSMSTMDDKTFKSMFHNFTASCGILHFKEYGEIYRPKEVLIESLYEKLKDALVVKRAEDDPDEIVSPKEDKTFQETGASLIVENFKGGFKLVFGHQLLFAPGGADISDEMIPILQRIGSFMRNSDYQVYIDGHTDNIPIRSGTYPSNEDLSLARAFNLMEYFVKQESISPLSIALAGYGDAHPADTNQSPEGRARNRRVEIIFKSQKYF
ncbi:MAG: OmpA family protein [Deltaproteobacteria bacterium]|nr:OmpA family protein [Deltaproteobacteria bacterium]